MATRFGALFALLLVSACAAQESPVQLTSQVVPILEEQSILIRLDHGEVTVVGGGAGFVRVDGEVLSLDRTDLEVTSTGDQIEIVANYTGWNTAGAPIQLTVSAPNNVKLIVETEFASVVVRDYEGELEVASISGDVLVQNVNGALVARSNRGNVSVQDSQGTVSVVGNYGLLDIANVRGDIGVSTIMGAIAFQGPVHVDDSVRLETDHGPVTVNLSADSALTLQVRSNSGDVACVLPGIDSSLRTCDGDINLGGGALSVRTVSGAVTLQQSP